MGAHARLSPSSSKRWITCPASVAREEGKPDTSGEAAIWGTAAHAILEQSLLQAVDPLDAQITGLTAAGENEELFIIEERYGLHDVQEMREVAKVAYDYAQLKGTIYAEAQVNPGAILGRDDMYGTSDITLVTPRTLEIVDLKSGFRVVEPDDSQLWIYGGGALEKHRRELEDFDNTQVTMTIVQPRAPHAQGPIRSITVPASHVMQWITGPLYRAALETDNPDARAVPSEEGCRYCKVKATCPELAEQGMAAAQAVFQPVEVGGDRHQLADALTRNPDQLGPEEIRFILDNEGLISGWLAAVREFATKTLNDGGIIPGYKMVVGRGSRSWSLDEKDLYAKVKNLTLQNGKKVTRKMLYTEKFLTPAAAEKSIKGLMSAATWKRVQEFVVKSAGKPTLAPETDSRPSVVTAEDVFEKVPAAEIVPDFLQ